MSNEQKETQTPGTSSEQTPTVNYSEVAAGGISGRLARFRGGIGAARSDIVPANHIVGETAFSVNVPTINGKPVGTWRNGALWLSMAQLRMAPAEDLLCSRYQPGSDPYYDQRKTALQASGDDIPALPITISKQSIMIHGEEEPLFLVMDRPEIYFSLADIKLAEAKVEFVVIERDGGALLRALGASKHGVMHIEPSQLEVCHAVKRLRVYGFTWPEIAVYMAKNSEDGTRPSEATLISYVNVANLPERAQDFLHRGLMLWTHARDIAAKFGEDSVLSERFAVLASQDGQMTTRALNEALKRVSDGLTKLVEQDGTVKEVELPSGPRLVEKRLGKMPIPTYAGTMTVKPILIQQESSRHTVVVVPDEQTVTPASFVEHQRYINGITANTPIAEVEARFLGFLQAVRDEAKRKGVVNEHGVIMPVVESKKTESR